jgi:hypothetical protein
MHLKLRGFWAEHHGIFLGENQVAHNHPKNGRVIASSVEEFAHGKRIAVVVHRDGFEPAEVISRARSRIENERYRLVRSNCEQLANWAADGRRRSLQVRAAVGLSTPIVAFVADVATHALRALGIG